MAIEQPVSNETRRTMSGAIGEDELRSNHLISELLSLELDPDHFVIIGSGPLLAHGIRKRIRDLDIVARGAAWTRACEHKGGEMVDGDITGAEVISFFDKRIQISQEWIVDEWKTDDLIDNAEIIAGLRFASLERVLAYKKMLNRDKDRTAIKVIKRWLAANQLLKSTGLIEARATQNIPAHIT